VSYIRMTCHASDMRGAKKCMQSARALFRRFHCFSPPAVTRTSCRRNVPDVVVQLGRLKGLIYSSDRGQCGRPRTFIHFMDTPPVLACNPSGTQLYVLGGRYRVTRRGIEG
jgi:hypothetical protein